MSKQITVGTAFFVAAAVLVAVLTSPILAANNKGSSAASLTESLNTPVMFNQEVYARTTDEISAPLTKRVSQYTKAVMTGRGLHGQVEVTLNGLKLYVPAETLSTGEKAIAELEAARDQADQKREEEEKQKAGQEAETQETAGQETAVQQEAEQSQTVTEAPAADTSTTVTETVVETQVVADTSYSGSGSLTASAGVFYGPSGKETYYNLDMSGVVSIMRSIGNTDEYWVRSDGVKMLGNYVMVAADLSIRPRGSLVQTSLGMGIVCDTGSFIYSDPTQLDIAVAW